MVGLHLSIATGTGSLSDTSDKLSSSSVTSGALRASCDKLRRLNISQSRGTGSWIGGSTVVKLGDAVTMDVRTQ